MKMPRLKWFAMGCMTAAAIASGPLFAGIGAPLSDTTPAAGPGMGIVINGAASGLARKVEGGDVISKVTDTAPIYQGVPIRRAPGLPVYSNIKMSLDADAGRPMWLLLKAALDGKEQAFDGTLESLDASHKDVSNKSFHGGLITGITLPGSSGTSNNPYFVVTLDEESVTTSTGNGATFTSAAPSQKTFTNSRVSLAIDSLQLVTSSYMEALDIKANAKSMTVTNHLVLHFAASPALSGYMTWAKGTVVPKNGQLKIMTVAGDDMIDFDLTGVVPVKLSTNGMDAGASQVTIVTLELAITGIKIGGGSLLQ